MRNDLFATGCILVSLSLTSVTQARDWTVSTDGAAINETLSQVEHGDRIVLAPGRYRVNLRIDKSITLEGEKGAILDGGGTGDVIRVHAPDVTVRGLELVGSGNNLTHMNALVFIDPEARNTRIEGNRLTGDAFGIWVDGADDVRIIDNHIQGNPEVRSQDRGNGIHLFNTSGTVVEGNEVSATRDGIYIDTSNHNVLRSNYMHDLRYGIHYMYSYNNEVIDNRTAHTRTGYALMQSKYLTVRGNRSVNDRNYGMLMNYIVYSEISDNVINRVLPGTSRIGGSESVAGAEGKAVFIYNSQFNTINGNLFANSDIGIHLTAGSEDNRIFGNAFIRNQTQVKYVATRLQEWSSDGGGNYWSDYIGYDMNGDGFGDTPYEPNDGIDRVLWKYPIAKLLLHSPAVETLHWVQRQFPVLRPPGVKDSYPLISRPDVVGRL